MVIDPVLALALGVCILIFIIGHFTARRNPPELLPLYGLDVASEEFDAALESGSPLASVVGGTWSYGISECCAALSIRNCLDAYASRLFLPVPLISSAAFVILPAMSDGPHNQAVRSKPMPAPVEFTGPEPLLLASAQLLQTGPGICNYLAVYGALSYECALLVTAPERAHMLVCATSLPLSALFATHRTEALVFGEHFYACPAYLGSVSAARSLRAHDWVRWSILLVVLAGIVLTLLGFRGGGL